MNAKEVPVLIRSESSGKTCPGRVHIQSWSKKERAVRALKWGLLCLGAAILSVFIPLLHFILVPVFLIASPLIASWLYSQQTIVRGGHGHCPRCDAEFIVATSQAKFPLSDICSMCKSSVVIQLSPAGIQT